jgi:hypothetical protein
MHSVTILAPSLHLSSQKWKDLREKRDFVCNVCVLFHSTTFYSTILCPDDELITIRAEMHIHAGLNEEGLILSTLTKSRMFWQILLKLPNVETHEYPSSSSWVDPHRQTDRHGTAATCLYATFCCDGATNTPDKILLLQLKLKICLCSTSLTVVRNARNVVAAQIPVCTVVLLQCSMGAYINI